MAKDTGIAWADHTLNFVWGCTEVSPGCDHCYAHTFAKRTGFNVWGADSTRRTFGDRPWLDALKWNAAAHNAGERRRVFCMSMGDWCDAHSTVVDLLPRLWQTWRATPWLDWLMLTKRHARIEKSLPDDWGSGYPNVWLGVSAENQEWLDRRVPVLLSVPAAVRFVSAEPLLGPIDLKPRPRTDLCVRCGEGPAAPHDHQDGYRTRGLDWIICGGESGPQRRSMDLAWLTSIIDQCHFAGVPVFVKQDGGLMPGQQGRIPDKYWIQQFPQPVAV